MAGNYPDVPGPRVPYDIDGSQIVHWDGTTIASVASTELPKIQDEANTYSGSLELANTSHWVALLFPAPVDLVGWFATVWSTTYSFTDVPGGFQTSVDTTTGLDGTWVAQTNVSLSGASDEERARKSIVSGSVAGVVGVRLMGTNLNGACTSALHLYGSPSSAVGDRLELWHPTLDQRLGGAALDFGNSKRGTSADLTFRVKNVSATKTANTVALALEALTDTTPTVVGSMSLDYNGGGFGATAAIGTLAAGAVSNLCTLRRTTSSTAVLGPWQGRVKATAASFT